ncbi:hypothetical protein [Deinococcus cellulosilyticus]|uniref:Uncharacterized protein n=1 Tax=Deinococcus cellulosilyticus (strain DSM 18568 / NBRC 106333 / KACC 11606 / 5516J-15) TaxID=1223518 RepID=A0A511N3N4_DEIC1|nr:hypothetical protein [Deinococcus cellulosilyticus]GEM47480.1 hypothetical protein DC3_31150 [Deinococcus cellulosilyticus NBRC 106333 = KACC 11606]
MEVTPNDLKKEFSQRGFELDAHLKFASELTQAHAEEAIKGWTGLTSTFYGEADRIRAVRLTGDIDRDLARQELRKGLESGLLRGAELGFRAFLRSERSFEFMPWLKNRVLKTTDLDLVDFWDGIKYILE